jgi:AhpD family alkylhydroperoxidase
MVNDWSEFTKSLSADLRELRTGVPDVMKAFSSLAIAAGKPDALDAKTKELIALAIGVSVRCDDCIAFHTKAAISRGATRQEIMETLGMAIYMGAGPSVMYASHALAAYDEFSGAKAPNAE